MCCKCVQGKIVSSKSTLDVKMQKNSDCAQKCFSFFFRDLVVNTLGQCLIVNTLGHCKGVGLVQGFGSRTLYSYFLIVGTPGL